MNRFEQLIEYVINDDTQKAQELFHEIVVEKSRQIYEDIMAEEADELEEGEDLEEGMGGDAADDLIDDVEAEEQDDMNMEAEGDDDMEMDVEVDGDAADMGGDDFGGDDMGGSDEAATKDDIMNLEDKLDQLMAEFEGLMGGDDMGGDDMGNGDGFGDEEGGDAIEMDDTEEMTPGMMESLDLKAAPKPVTSEEGGVNKKSTVAANAGAKGPIGNSVKPVHTGADGGGHHDASPYKNTVKEIGTPSTQEAGKKAFKTAAPKPVTGQASGVNNRSITPGGRG
jgi:hypothetical protein